jgi:hypothetical protein
VNLALPTKHRLRYRFFGRASQVVALRAPPAPLHDGLDGTAHAYEENGQTCEPLEALRKRRQTYGIGIVVADIGHHVQPRSAVSGNRVVHGGIGGRHEGFQVGPFAAWSEADARPKASRRHVTSEHIDSEVHPDTVEGSLDGSHDGRFP